MPKYSDKGMMIAGTSLLLTAIVPITSASAQLLSNSPIRIQVGNGAALLGPSTPDSKVGISILSNQVGTHTGTSVRLLGNETLVGANTKLINTNSTGRTTILVPYPGK